ncbi:MAG: hypothetical protein SOI38_05555 [Eggerthellaceae bacterium]
MAVDCFQNGYLTEALKACLRKMRDEASGLTSNDMDKTSRNEWVDYLVSKYEIEPLEIHPEMMSLDFGEKTVRQYNAWSKVVPDEPEYLNVAGIRATCKVPFTGDAGLLKFTPTTSTIRPFRLDRLVEPSQDHAGYLCLSYEMTQREASAEGIRAHFTEEATAFKNEAEYANADIANFNSSLRTEVEKAVDKRIGQLDKLIALRKDLGLPLNAVEGMPMAKPLVLTRKKLVYPKPRPTDAEYSYAITDADYKSITTIIDMFGSSMERTPGSFVSLGEEQLRDQLLAALSTHYENATGETFRNHGKTDIHIPFESHSAYIAECKIWHGKKKFLDAIEQLFSYTTWRDTKVSVVIFNKEVNDYRKVLSSIQDALDTRAHDVIRSDGHALWSCRIQNSEDGRIMHTTVHAFNLYYSDKVKAVASVQE